MLQLTSSPRVASVAACCGRCGAVRPKISWNSLNICDGLTHSSPCPNPGGNGPGPARPGSYPGAEVAWSSAARFRGSMRVSYAPVNSAIFIEAVRSPVLRSGWYCLANSLKRALISAPEAPRSTPMTAYASRAARNGPEAAAKRPRARPTGKQPPRRSAPRQGPICGEGFVHQWLAVWCWLLLLLMLIPLLGA